MSKVKDRLLKLIRREEGASFTEYGLLLVIVVLAIGAAAITLQTDIVAFLNNIGSEISGASVPNIP